MTALAVKHNTLTQKPLVSILGDVCKHPYSFSKNRGKLANDNIGSDVYVIETSKIGDKVIYKLGYRYKLGFVEEGIFGDFGEFRFKNLADSNVPFEGFYFDCPVRIHDASFVEWYKKTQGMIRISESKYVAMLDALITNPANNAKFFK